MTRRTFLGIGLGLLVLAAGAAGAAAWVLYDRVHAPFKGYPGAEQFVEVPRGASVTAIGEALSAAGIVRDPLTFRLAAWITGAERRLQSGEYRFDRAVAAVDVVEKIARGDVYLRPITFPEGLKITEMAPIFEAAGFGTADEFLKAAADPSPIAELDPEAPNLEGYLFPDTYRLPRSTTAAELVRVMVRGFERAFSEELRGEAAARGYSVREAVTLASLVEKETAVAEERPLVSGVYTNRLRIGMGLQCDPTVIYALELAGRYDGNLTRADLAFDSPYNTYRYPGLPPGPIASPGRASLEAAVRPADVDYLYFVSRNDGSHVFARTLAEHNRNVYEHQILYFRNKRLAEQSNSPEAR